MMENSEANLVQLLLEVQKSGLSRDATSKKLERAVNELIIVYIASLYGSREIALRELLAGLEKKIVVSVLGMTNMSEKEASQLLGVKRSTLCEKLKRFNLRSNQLKQYPHWHLVSKLAGLVSASSDVAV